MPSITSGSSADVGQHHGAALRLHASAQRVGHRARLLVDLLQHEVPVAALLGQDRIPEDADRRPLDGRAVELGDLDAVTGHHRHVLVLEHDDVAGVGEDGGDVGGDERLALAESDHHAAGAVLGRDQPVGGVPGQHHDGVGAAQLAERAPYRLLEPRRVAQMALDQMGDDLGVGLRGEAMAVGLELLLDGQVVLDDPVVHDDEVARPVGVGMRVLVGGAAVGRPARVADADRAAHRDARAGGLPAP